MKRISLYILIILLGCQKENSEINVNRDKFIGNYCGEIIGNGWSPFNTTIRKSETDSNMIVFDYFVGGDSVEAFVDGYNIIIPEKTYRKSGHTSAGPWGQTYYYDLTVSGNGVLDISNYLLQINLTLKETYEDGDNNITESVIKMYNSSKYSYIGTFTGDSTTVIITPYNDNLLVSITFPEYWIPNGWDSIKASESQCSISFSVDSIKDISSGEIYKLRGGGHKLGDSLCFTIFAYYHCLSPLYIYDLTVTKDH